MCEAEPRYVVTKALNVLVDWQCEAEPLVFFGRMLIFVDCFELGDKKDMAQERGGAFINLGVEIGNGPRVSERRATVLSESHATGLQ